MKRGILFSIIAMIGLASCQQKEDFTLPVDGEKMTFYASIADDATKTIAEVEGEKTKVLWAEGDAYAMSVKGGAFAKFTLEGEGGQTTGTFTGTATAGDGTQNVAYYPYADGITMVDGKLNVVIPAEQDYTPGSIAAAPMVAVSADNTLKFQNVASLIKITLQGDETIKSVSLTGNNDEILAGNALVTLEETPSLALAADAEGKNITLDCGEGIELSKDGVDFYFAVPAITLENGFTLVITDIENKVMTKTTTNEVELSASKVKVFPAFDYEASLTASPNYAISSAKGLRWIAEQVNSGANSFAGATIILANDIDLNNEEWIPIGSVNQEHGFMGNFDGNGKTIKNLKMTQLPLDADNYVYAGLFGVTEGTDPDNQNYIKDLVIENVTIKTTGHIAAAAIAYPYYTVVENITVKGNISIEGGDYTAGVLAYTRRCIDAENISIEGNDGSSIKGAKTVGGVISDIQMNGGLIANYSNFSASGLTITGEKSVGGISGIISGQTLDGATVKNITLSGNRLGVVSGSMGNSSVIKDIVIENVSGATATVGYDYDSGNPIEAKIGDKYYSTLLQALSNVEEGETIKLTEDITLTDILVIDKNIIFDGNGHTLTSSAGRAINVSGATDVTIMNLTINASGERAINIIQNAKNVTIEGVTATAANYTVNVAASAPEAVVVINNSTLTGLNVVNVGSAGADVNVSGSTINCNDKAPAEGYGALFLNRDAVNGKIVATDCTINIPEGSGSMKGVNSAENGVITINGSTEGVEIHVAYIEYGNNGYSFSSLKDAVEYAKSGETVALLRDVVLNEALVVNSDMNLILDLNGKTVSQKLVCTQSYNMITNRGALTIQGNGKLSLEDLSNGGGDKWGSYTIYNYGTLVIENGVIEHLGTSDDDHDTSIPIQNYQGKVVVNGGTISSPEFRSLRDFTAGGTIEINGGVFNGQVWMQGLGSGSSSLTVNGGEFSPCYGYDGSSIYITNNTNIINVEITGGKFNTKVGCFDPTKEGVKGSISGGNFTQTAKDNTNAALITEGYIFDQLNDGTFNVVPSDSEN